MPEADVVSPCVQQISVDLVDDELALPVPSFRALELLRAVDAESGSSSPRIVDGLDA
jgi:hypothetical protein